MGQPTMGDPVLEALWKKAVDNWEDDRTHGSFLEHCQNTEQLAEAAVRYRGMKGDRDRGEIAAKRLEAVAMLAFASLEASRAEAPKHARSIGGIVVIIFFVVSAILLLNVVAR